MESPMRRFGWPCLFLLWFTTLYPANVTAATAEQTIVWVEQGPADEARVHLYFFWSRHCPHCLQARPFVDSLASRHPWLQLHALEVGSNPENGQIYMDLAAALGQQARSVPAFVFCGLMTTGFNDAGSTGVWLEDQLLGCKHWAESSAFAAAHAPPVDDKRAATASLGLPAGLDLETLSLPATTLILAALDSFNPCAFFVLLFLLSLLVHARSRARMWLVGSTFVLISGLVYFLFMAAWLNIFMYASQLHGITLAAGLLAVLIALINIKDFFRFHEGISLSIPDGAKPGLFKRMRGLINARSLPATLLGTVVLALVANSYELLCTAGFPMVFTRILTLNPLPPFSYYGYLALYNMIYVLPLLVIVTLFSMTLGARKLSEAQGRALKLLSGLMMLGLGMLLVLAPEALNNPLIALALLLLAISLTWALSLWRHRETKRS